jgi:hypothetical protein
MSDGLVVVIFLGALFTISGIMYGCVEYEQLPRGFRWIGTLWESFRAGLQWLLLRIFYPEKLRDINAILVATGLARKAIEDNLTLQQLEYLDECWRKGWTVWSEDDQRWCPPKPDYRAEDASLLADLIGMGHSRAEALEMVREEIDERNQASLLRKLPYEYH